MAATSSFSKEDFNKSTLKMCYVGTSRNMWHVTLADLQTLSWIRKPGSSSSSAWPATRDVRCKPLRPVSRRLPERGAWPNKRTHCMHYCSTYCILSTYLQYEDKGNKAKSLSLLHNSWFWHTDSRSIHICLRKKERDLGALSISFWSELVISVSRSCLFAVTPTECSRKDR